MRTLVHKALPAAVFPLPRLRKRRLFPGKSYSLPSFFYCLPLQSYTIIAAAEYPLEKYFFMWYI